MLHFSPNPYLSEHVAHERFVQLGVLLDEFKEVQSISVLLHHHLEVVLVLIGLQQLQGSRFIDMTIMKTVIP